MVDQPILARGCGLSVHGSGAAADRVAACDTHRVPRRLWGVGDWVGACVRNLGEDCQRLRPGLHAFAAVLRQLPRRSRSSLAVFRSLTGSFCTRPLLSDLYQRPQ